MFSNFRIQYYTYLGKNYDMVISHLPDAKWYGVEMFKADEKKEFDEWYEQANNDKQGFNFNEDLLSYCQQVKMFITLDCFGLFLCSMQYTFL
jgi:hypothetical protein